ncbi:hypothetical protein NX773_21850 [Massilia solisilvae]|uniref:Uncharacterized protein n=1 Tax=Massilia solisilvae TaxID=1811225 RepID=A0ABT2BQP5_9BURK|nr:hypothetical protein [Massilia solisilvae]MCS0610819.1 hypothetical protein [Massilia solisilvae]
MIWAIACIGLAAVAASVWRRQWIDAALVAVAALALALVCGEIALPVKPAATLDIDPKNPPHSLDGVAALRLKGDGLRAAQWDDLPARPLAWDGAGTGGIALDFPRQLALGRMFVLTVHRPAGAPARLQLLAENGWVLSEAKGEGDLSVQWLPSVAEQLVLRARLLASDGSVIDEGPVPFRVSEAQPLRVQGRFGAPSFDLRVLDELLAGSNALLDWQISLGKALTRSETPREAIGEPNLLLVDAAWFEHATPAQRGAMLAQAEHGATLLILGANAADPAIWSRILQLDLKPQPDKATEGAPLAMSVAPFNPSEHGPWHAAGKLLWTRQWHMGRIGWLGAADWHRYAISDPHALALWWQSTLDALGVTRAEPVEWLAPDEMPLPGQRLEVCARGVKGTAVFPGLRQKLAWQRRPDRVDASCVAVWPQKSGWLQVESPDSDASSAVYIFAPADWREWQAQERRHATARYAARTPVAAQGFPAALPRWPFAVVFALAMLALWWRERR